MVIDLITLQAYATCTYALMDPPGTVEQCAQWNANITTFLQQNYGASLDNFYCSASVFVVFGLAVFQSETLNDLNANF
jgi:hypothetical protein